MRARLESIYLRIKRLDGLMYAGAGFHYQFYRDYWKVVRFLSQPADTDVGMNVVDQVVWEGLLQDLAKAEHSAVTDCARYNRQQENTHA